MKNYLLSYTANLVGSLSILFFAAGCMSEVTDPAIPADQQTEAKLSDDFYTYPLENLRMDPGTLSTIASLRNATAMYHQIEVALEAGYFQGSDCVAGPNGGMGYHYIRPDNPAGPIPFDGMLDPTMPEALLYEMDKNGKMKLVGVEFIVDADAWDAENEMPPYFGMKELDEVQPPLPLPFRNYQLHVWTWKHNPSGIFTPYNPTVKCN